MYSRKIKIYTRKGDIIATRIWYHKYNVIVLQDNTHHCFLRSLGTSSLMLTDKRSSNAGSSESVMDNIHGQGSVKRKKAAMTTLPAAAPGF